MTASTLVGAPRGAVLEAATRSSVPKGESSAHDIGLCGAAAVDLLSRRFGVAGEPVDLLQFASTVVTLGDVADALEGRGMSARFVEGLTRAQLDSLAPDECVILVLTPEVEGRSAHLLVGIPSKQDGFVLLDPIGPWPDRPISMDGVATRSSSRTIREVSPHSTESRSASPRAPPPLRSPRQSAGSSARVGEWRCAREAASCIPRR